MASNGKVKSIDPAAIEMLEIAEARGIETAFSRADDSKACPVGATGACCKMCAMGPCRLVGKTKVGLCGATLATVAARNFARMVAAGASAHSDHGRDLAFTLIAVAKGEGQGYRLRDVTKLHAVADYMGIATQGRTTEEVALDVGTKALEQFGQQSGAVIYTQRATPTRQKLWREGRLLPRGIDREVVEIMHRTHMGVDMDAENILDHCLRASLGDGWGGSMLATDISDILFGTPAPLRSQANLGVLKDDEVNLIVHGHEPTLSEMIVAAAQDPEMIEYARSKGAKGINLAGICCTSNEVLMRHGIPPAGNFLHQELAIVTGAVEAMIVDVQCIMQALAPLAKQYHTELITTSPKAKITGATHLEFDEHRALDCAKEIVRRAVDNYPKRGEVHIPSFKENLVAGFSHEYIAYMQGGYYRGSFRPLNDAIVQGRIRGAAAIVGCNNARVTHDDPTITIARELIAQDVLVVVTGCAAHAAGKHGLLAPETMAHAGPGLREVCEAIGVPPILHLGSCVDNSRILTVLTQMATEGGLGEDIDDLPAVGICPEWMSEKAISIGTYCAASGAYVLFGVHSPVEASEEVTRLIGEGWEAKVGGQMEFEPDTQKIIQKTLAHIDAKRAALGLAEYDPKRFGRSGDQPLQDYFAVPAEQRSLYSRKAQVASGD
ncbi:MAG: anaerobic carbon-monoxide dehydrogenase catalytic subunit [Chloroflexi bacterium]|nr:anaerobic carbon-monoxide dehydrogenase catalytic subunit [Chloroflexota bacterium]